MGLEFQLRETWANEMCNFDRSISQGNCCHIFLKLFFLLHIYQNSLQSPLWNEQHYEWLYQLKLNCKKYIFEYGSQLKLHFSNHVTCLTLHNPTSYTLSQCGALFKLQGFPISPFASQCCCFPMSVLLPVDSAPPPPQQPPVGSGTYYAHHSPLSLSNPSWESEEVEAYKRQTLTMFCWLLWWVFDAANLFVLEIVYVGHECFESTHEVETW